MEEEDVEGEKRGRDRGMLINTLFSILLYKQPFGIALFIGG